MNEAQKFLFSSTLQDLKIKRQKLLEADVWDRQDAREIEWAVERIDKELKLREVWAE